VRDVSDLHIRAILGGAPLLKDSTEKPPTPNAWECGVCRCASANP